MTVLTSASGLHPLHRLWRALPAGARRRWLARGTALLAPRPDWPAPAIGDGVIVGGELGRPSGLGEGARLMLRALHQLGIPATPLEAGLPVPGEQAEPQAAPRQAAAPLPAGALVLHVNPPVLPAALLRLPRGLLSRRRVIGYWAWELPVVPASWRAGLPFVHEVWVPSRFTAEAIEKLLPGRVRVVPHPLAAAPPAPAALGRDAFGLPADAVVTLVSFSMASSFARKNPLGAIAAHRAAFGDREDRVLLLKVAHPEHHPQDFAALREAVGSSANIRLESRTLPAADSHALTACADIVLSLHRSEGFGLVPAEAMLLGRAVVATGWSGNMDFMDVASACLIGHQLVPARDPRGVFEAPGAVWAEPDIAEAAAALRRLADDPPERHALGARGRAMATARLGTAPLVAALAAGGLAAPGTARPA
jgi:glycosyltransferase involved in cell wall biosynthesis